jgi:outer membrane protein assembly factor BamB
MPAANPERTSHNPFEATGETSWTAAVPASAAPALADGAVLVPTTDGRVQAFAAAGCGAGTCSPLWEVSVGTARGLATHELGADERGAE